MTDPAGRWSVTRLPVALGLLGLAAANVWALGSLASRGTHAAAGRMHRPVQQTDLEDPEPPSLSAAVAECDVAAVEELLDRGGRQFVGGRFRLFGAHEPSLESALACGPEMAVLLVAHGVENDGGDPVLQAAVRSHDEALVGAVLAAGADVDAVDDSGDTALLQAVTLRDGAIVAQLLAAGADPNIAAHGGHTPLHRAVGLGETAMVEQLLAAGASPGGEVPVGVLEALLANLDADEAHFSRVLQAFGAAADADGNLPAYLGEASTLFVAAVLGDTEIVRLLLTAGADPLVAGGLDETLPVDAARIMGHDDVVALLGG
jgi:hypothetical protein